MLPPYAGGKRSPPPAIYHSGGFCRKFSGDAFPASHAKDRSGVISTQVLREFYSAATRKPGIEPLQARQHLRDFRVFDIVQVTPAIIEEGIDCSILHQLSFWDALILAAAATANSTELLSEDLSHEQKLQGITIRNPFV